MSDVSSGDRSGQRNTAGATGTEYPRTEHTLHIEERDGYLYAETTGRETADVMYSVFMTLIDHVVETDCNRVLYVEGFDNQIPVPEMVHVIDKIVDAAQQAGIHARFAVYDRNVDHAEANIAVGTLARARGIHARTFGSLADAVAWIKAD